MSNLYRSNIHINWDQIFLGMLNKDIDEELDIANDTVSDITENCNMCLEMVAKLKENIVEETEEISLKTDIMMLNDWNLYR